ncbi:MAG: response regulator [Synergistaceae bacterium]|jgi:signal transduction histidine kinase/CheY-like chemotaxis protein|nr:response regulator [Synergistaceae bacterium]
MRITLIEKTPGLQEPVGGEGTFRELNYLRGISEANAAKILALDAQSIAIRHELEQKRRGFALLAELSVSLRRRAGRDSASVFASAARRINAALNMQRTVVLTPDGEGHFRASVLQGYPEAREKIVASRNIDLDRELLDPERLALVTGADPADHLAALREAMEIPYLISSALLYDNTVEAILITGRMVEEAPFLPRLGRGDVETVQAVGALLAAVLAEQRLEDKLRQARDIAEKSARAKGEFLANMSHEVRTPVNAILGMMRLLEGPGMTDVQRQYLEQAAHSTRLLLRVFDDILDYSRLDMGRLTLQSAEFSIRGVVKSVRGAVEEQARAKALLLNADVAANVPDAVLGDSLRVEQMLLNLVGNAVKFTQEGRVDIRVSCLPSPPEIARLLFEVEDTGVGISEEQVMDLFLPFTQADASHTRKHGGTGLGLAISRSLANLMSGELRCETRLGEGSTFSFTVALPLAREARDAQSEEPDVILQGMKVLLAEDNEINQMVAMGVLSDMGVEVTVAANGVEALSALEQEAYDLVLMDIQMPEMDGLTATTRIRENPKYKDLPVIALTAHALPEDREASLKSGMNDHLTKPIDPDEIYAALRHWTKGKTQKQVSFQEPKAFNAEL